MWVVYQPAPPYPRNHVAREFAITGAGQRLTGKHAVGPLDVMRGYLADQLGLACLGRASEDDPSIVEVWV